MIEMSTCLYLFQDALCCLRMFGGWVAQTGRTLVTCGARGSSESRVVHASAGGVEPCFGLSGWAPATVTAIVSGAFSPLSCEGTFTDRSIDRSKVLQHVMSKQADQSLSIGRRRDGKVPRRLVCQARGSEVHGLSEDSVTVQMEERKVEPQG
jgi:hypothetical protein